MATSSALAKREQQLQRRESSHKARLAREHADERLARVENEKKGILRRAADEPFVDSIAEFGGTLGEAAIKSQVPVAHPFTPLAAVLIEIGALLSYRKRPGKSELRTVASLARGAQARARVEMADATINAIFA